ncbi:MAG: hypothetical protein JJ971_00755 [Balneolaceae bacterium]|nr:hypothetical protein [Balneolaceae bacterium]MBO6544899.1 hypothetical protein [Balneolaceae bacterium]MBO6646295.1 hypothetical protein [Balneolaceae bacterium]
MQKVIDQITDHLVSLVTSDKAEYNPKELLKSGIPSFVVERIRLYLEDKVREEIGDSTPKWFDGEARLVSDAFNDYVRSAISTSRIPKDELYEVIHAVVKDIIFVFIEPRKNMAEYLFRDDDELPFEEIEERCSRLTIYKHFGTAVPLYMKKRSLDSLSKERCKLLIHKLDAKLVASYSAQDWAQKLEQLFILFGGKIDPMLLSTFFEDKGLYGMAGKFEALKEPLTKSDFIEIISSKELAEFSTETKPEKSNAKEEKKAAEEVEKISEEDASEQTLIESFFGNYEYVPQDEESGEETLAAKFSDGSLSDEEMSELLTDIANDGVVEVEDFDQVASLNKLFSLSGESEDDGQASETSEEIAAKIKEMKEADAEDVAEFRENLISILDQAKNSFETIERGDQPDEIEVEDIADVFVDEEEVADDEYEADIYVEDEPESEGEEKPMWAKFLNDDQMDVLMGGERNSKEGSEAFEEEIQVDDDYSEEPVIDVESDITPEETPEINLEDLLVDRKAEFIEVIFSGSEKKFDKALEKIKTFESWKETSDFIQKDVFKKNKVDLFSGATVDFTDRLHQYFNELQNS